MSDGKGYSARHLEHRDYYADGERVTGRWQGRGAGFLGLSGEVQFEDFEAVRQGNHPVTGAFLRNDRARTVSHPTGSRSRVAEIFTTSRSPRPNPFPLWASSVAITG